MISVFRKLTMAQVKICGLKQVSHLQQAIESGASHIGFVFYPPSPRAVTISDLAALLAHIQVPETVKKVGLFVNPDDQDLIAALPYLDMIQLHGSETPERVTEIRNITDLPIMKAFAIADKKDLAQIASYDSVIDWYLFDAKPPKVEGALPGGNGISFDWQILAGENFEKPWMLSGGLTCENVAEAVNHTKADFVDVSSGVEIEKGVKDNHKIDLFIKQAGVGSAN